MEPSATTEANSNATLNISRPLAGNMDQAIGEATVVMGAVVTELMRRSLRGGVLKVGEQLEAYVGECVDQTIAERRPAIEQAAADAAEQTALTTAARVAGEKVFVLEQRTTEVTRTLAAQIEEADHRAQQTTREVAREMSSRLDEKAQRLAGDIEEAERRARAADEKAQRLAGAIEEKGQQLTACIEEGDRQAIQMTRETARELSGQIEEAEKRVSHATQAEMQQRHEEFLEKARKGTKVLKASIDALAADFAELGKQLAGEREARVEVAACLDRLALDLRQENERLSARVAELERPRGLRRLWTWLFGRRNRPAAD
jgi:chromosome segregation ATPase